MDTLKILVVEDDDVDYQLLAETLRVAPPRPYVLDRANSVDMALDLHVQQRYDLFIVDYVLNDPAGKTGLQLIRRLQDLARPPGILCVSDHAHLADDPQADVLIDGTVPFMEKSRLTGDLVWSILLDLASD